MINSDCKFLIPVYAKLCEKNNIKLKEGVQYLDFVIELFYNTLSRTMTLRDNASTSEEAEFWNSQILKMMEAQAVNYELRLRVKEVLKECGIK